MPGLRPAFLLVLAILLLPARARAQDAASVADLAQLLSLEDHRTPDVAILQRASQHPDSMVRRRAAMSMGRIGDHAAVPMLLTMLNDRDTVVRAEAVFALGELGDRAAAAELANLTTRFPSTAVSDLELEIVTALAKIGGPVAEPALEAILARHPPSLNPQSDRATAIVLLEAFRLGRTSAIATRLKDYIRGPSGEWRRNAAYSATRLTRFYDAAPALLEAATDPDAWTRSYVARGLVAAAADSAGIQRDAFLAPLRNLINDADAQVRTNALRALGSYADSALVPLAASRMVDRDPNVPVQAAATLGALKGSRAASVLKERLASAPSFGLRRAILLALASVDDTAAIAAARTWRTDADWRLRAGYADMLGVAGTPAARQQLTEMLVDPEPRVVGVVLGALENLVPAGDSALLAIARGRLAAPDVIVRATALNIVAREHDPASIRDIAAAYRRAEPDALDDARLAAVRGLADIMDGSPASRSDVETALLTGNPRSNDAGVRRLVAARFGDAAMRRSWGDVGPVETGRTAVEYQALVRRYVIGEARPGHVTIETERGSIVLTLYSYDAPLTVDNFVRLIDRRFFDNGRWHRVVPNFVVQDGDPRGDGSGGPGTTIRDEINRHRYGRGTVGMALSGPDTGGSQFFITHSPQPHLDGGYTVFGEVVSGWDVLDQIVQGDRIRRIFR